MSSPLNPFRAPSSSSQNLRSRGLLYEEGRASAEKTPMTKPGTIMNILEAAKKKHRNALVYRRRCNSDTITLP